MIDHILFGFSVVATMQNLLFCFLGCLLGTLIGVLPGIGPLATISMLLPLTFNFPPEGGLIMLAGIFYGAQYGGSTTAILLNLPGEVSSVPTTLDGYQMARQGRAGIALATSALSSFFAGCVATLVIAGFGPALVEVALKLGPAEYFSIMVLGLVTSTALGNGSVMRAIAMILVGILLGLVGRDVNSGLPRMTWDVPQLDEGINFVSMVMGLFGVSDIFVNLVSPEFRAAMSGRINRLLPGWSDVKQAFLPTVRGTTIGSLCGLLPGTGVTLGAFSAYMLEKRISRTPERFGKGAIEGVAAPESANNAAAQTAFIPLLSLGIPGNPVMAVMMGAMIIHSIAPGPLLMEQHPRLFWGVVVSMWIGNLMLVIINLPLIGIWVKLLTVPYRMLYPAILLFCAVGAYSMDNSFFDVMMMALFGVVGLLLRKLEFEPAPLVLGFVLGPMMEENLRRALAISRGDPAILIQQPISACFLVASAILLAIVILPSIRKGRGKVFSEAG